MGRHLSLRTVRPAELAPAERSLWNQFRAASPALASPYFDLRYTLAAAKVCPDAWVAIIHEDDGVAAFLPFQRRGGLIQPLGAPLSDYHGLIARPGSAIDLAEVVRLLGASRIRFSGLKTDARPAQGVAVHQSMVADLSDGFDAYLAARRGAGQGDFLKDKRRRMAALQRDHGPAEFSLRANDPQALAFILRLKRAQMARAGQHDVFDCGWTEQLVRGLLDCEAPDFGARIAALRVDGRIVAAEIGLLSGKAYHLWFPVYDPQFARYSPGQLMTLESMRLLAERGVDAVDFGPAGEAYKRAFAEPREQVFEGSITPNRVRTALTERLGLQAARIKLGRRFDRIAACEPHLPRRVLAASKYVGVVTRRHPAVSIGMGALGLGLALGALAE